MPCSRNNRHLIIGLIAIIAMAAVIILASNYLPRGIDWSETFRPAGLAVLRGKSPYSIDGFLYAPWAILPIIPFAWLPEAIGRTAFLFTSLFAFGYVAYKLGASTLSLAFFLVSPPILHCLLNANIDWLPLLGFVLPPQIGLFFVIIKPQIGIGVVLYWLFDTMRRGGLRETVRVFMPVSIALLASFALFGFWPTRFSAPITYWWNASLWPASLPVGLVLITASIRRSKIEFAMAASPCLSPYVLLHSWSGALVALAKLTPEMVVAVIGLWIVVIMKFIGAA